MPFFLEHQALNIRDIKWLAESRDEDPDRKLPTNVYVEREALMELFDGFYHLQGKFADLKQKLKAMKAKKAMKRPKAMKATKVIMAMKAMKRQQAMKAMKAWVA